MRYDLLVTGSGPAGPRAAIQAAVIERRAVVGGVGINTGTILVFNDPLAERFKVPALDALGDLEGRG